MVKLTFGCVDQHSFNNCPSNIVSILIDSKSGVILITEKPHPTTDVATKKSVRLSSANKS